MKIEKFNNKASYYLFLAIFISFFSACSEDNPVTTPTEITVNGKLSTFNGFEVPNATVTIGSSITTSASDGSFTIGNVTPPYDVSTIYGSAGTQFIGLTTASPKLSLSSSVMPQYLAFLKVQVPPMLSLQEACVTFVEGSNLQSTARILYPEDTTRLTIRWNGSNSITGKIIVMVYSVSGASVISYDNYGEKANYTLNNGAVQLHVFTAQDLSLNPGESTISGNINVPAGHIFQGSVQRISFDNASPTRGFILSVFSTTAFNSIVPTGLPSTPYFSVSASSEFAGSPSNSSLFVTPGSTGNNINIETPSVQSSPANNAINIDTNTNFVFSPGTGSGIYSVTFISGNKIFDVYTSSSGSVKIPNFSHYGLGLGANVQYNWYVEKFLSFNNIDEMVSAPINWNTKYSSYARSPMWQFTTTP